jgi:hypothetical protein
VKAVTFAPLNSRLNSSNPRDSRTHNRVRSLPSLLTECAPGVIMFGLTTGR